MKKLERETNTYIIKETNDDLLKYTIETKQGFHFEGSCQLGKYADDTFTQNFTNERKMDIYNLREARELINIITEDAKEEMETMTNYKEVKNEEKNGIERYYSGIPTYEEREALKKDGFRWNRSKSCWYKKIGASTKDATPEAEEKAPTLSTMRRITDFDEFMSIWSINNSYHYYGYQKKTPEQLKELERKDNLANFKKYAIYMLEDGFYLVFNTKPGIDSRLYYDDETEAPDKDNLNVFINYNMHNFEYDLSNWKKEIQSLNENGCCIGNIEINPFLRFAYYNHDSKRVLPTFYQYCGVSRKDEHFIREMSKAEIEDYITICDQLEKDYKERLTKYFYKYNKNIHTWGYWANR